MKKQLLKIENISTYFEYKKKLFFAEIELFFLDFVGKLFFRFVGKIIYFKVLQIFTKKGKFTK